MSCTLASGSIAGYSRRTAAAEQVNYSADMDEAYRIAQDRGVIGCHHGGQGAARGPQAGPPTGAGITCEQYYTPVAVVGAVPCAAGDRRGELLQVMLRDPSTGVRAADVARTVATRGCGPAIERGARTPPHALSVARQGTSEDALSTLRPQASRRLGCGRGSGRRALSRLHRLRRGEGLLDRAEVRSRAVIPRMWDGWACVARYC